MYLGSSGRSSDSIETVVAPDMQCLAPSIYIKSRSLKTDAVF